MHVCLRTALAQVFRLPSTRPNIRKSPVSVPTSIAPRHQKRHAQHSSVWQGPSPRLQGKTRKIQKVEGNTANNALEPSSGRPDPDYWLTALEPLLPKPLRRQPQSSPGARDQGGSDGAILSLVEQAQDAGVSIFEELGMKHQRWGSVMWLAERIIRDAHVLATSSDLYSSLPMPNWNQKGSLSALTNDHVFLEPRVQSRIRTSTTLEDFVSFEDSIKGHNRRKNALGLLWSSLGTMIVEAAPSAGTASGDETRPDVIPHVLEILALLHRHGVIPEPLYDYVATADPTALQKSPLLHLVSPRILTSVSDAGLGLEIKARSQENFFDHLPPGSHLMQARVPELGPEIWLEFVLWSCLHGGWISEGAAILGQVMKKGWGLRLQLDQGSTPSNEAEDWTRLSFWFTLGPPKPPLEDRTRVARTVTPELFHAFRDALINDVHVGVGARGIDLVEVWNFLLDSFEFLKQNSVQVSQLTSDHILLRLFGLVVEAVKPDQKETIHTIVRTGVFSKGDQVPDSQHSRSPAAALIFIHQSLVSSLRGIVRFRDTVKCLRQLKQSLKKERERILKLEKQLKKTSDGSKPDSPSTNNTFSECVPALPIPTLISLLDFVSSVPELSQEWFRQSIGESIENPDLHSDDALASCILRYAILTSQGKLFDQVMIVQREKANGDFNKMPVAVQDAFLELVIRKRDWTQLRECLDSRIKAGKHRPALLIMAMLIREMLLLREDILTRKGRNANITEQSNELAYLISTFRANVSSGGNYSDAVNTILAILASLNSDWAAFCAPLFSPGKASFLAIQSAFATEPFSWDSHFHATAISPAVFDIVLEGVTISYGARDAIRLCDMWWTTTHRQALLNSADISFGRLPPSRGRDYKTTDDSVMLEASAGGVERVFRGRVTPLGVSVRRILQIADKAKQSAKKKRQGAQGQAEFDEVAEWAERRLRAMGLREDELVDFGVSLKQKQKGLSGGPGGGLERETDEFVSEGGEIPFTKVLTS
ncbi:hypothetical protein K402DRAFT_397676 [Aulographum hederae CBS 113979]|uniref:Uncharacterized protein n=1 Tax=Aulographum hederae CBS 113979 TaxID=1176131 RepID=A0A6G1GMS8_9PEZI|nr:hypothetical protein K402DRAFT_397676 [Aulographum hederae CBS 113979]